jgi:hypothetical protein
MCWKWLAGALKAKAALSFERMFECRPHPIRSDLKFLNKDLFVDRRYFWMGDWNSIVNEPGDVA